MRLGFVFFGFVIFLHFCCCYLRFRCFDLALHSFLEFFLSYFGLPFADVLYYFCVLLSSAHLGERPRQKVEKSRVARLQATSTQRNGPVIRATTVLSNFGFKRASRKTI